MDADVGSRRAMRAAIIWLLAGVVGSIAGFVLLGLTTHSGGLLFILGNLLMPGVFIATLGDVTAAEGAFWTKVVAVQAVYYALVAWLIVRLIDARERE